MENNKQCNEIARVQVPWGGQILSYCPVHGNQLVMIANAIGNKIQPVLLATTASVQCQHTEECTEEEKELNRQFAF